MMFEFVEHDGLTRKARDVGGHGDKVSVLSLFDPRKKLYILIDLFKSPIVHSELSYKAMLNWIKTEY